MSSSENQSEVAQLRQQIKLEFAAMHNGLTGLASGTARHAIISARLRRIDVYEQQLAAQVGEDTATDIVNELNDAAIEQQQALLEPTKILWMFVCSEPGTICDQLVPFYATSREDAEQQAQGWIARQAPRRLLCVELRPYPDGFVIYRERLPGRI
jgi:hypothetical protein